MASVYLLSAARGDQDDNPFAHLELEHMLASAEEDRFGVHETCDDPQEAELILFVEIIRGKNHYFQPVRRHPLYRRFRWKCYLFAAADKVVPFLPGVYPSIERRWYSREWTRSGGYPGIKEASDCRYDEEHVPVRLFSFVGSAGSHRVRRRILQLQHPDAVLIDSNAESLASSPGEVVPVPREEFRSRYVKSIKDSAFVLCPRGGGSSTFRLFESMMLGRVPVIVSDQWVPPDGPDWESFSMRVKEREVDTIPAVLELRATDAPTMGRAARAAWVDWFSEGASFHRTVDWCLDLARFAPARAGLRRYTPYAQMLRPYHAAQAVAKRLGHGAALGERPPAT